MLESVCDEEVKTGFRKIKESRAIKTTPIYRTVVLQIKKPHSELLKTAFNQLKSSRSSRSSFCQPSFAALGALVSVAVAPAALFVVVVVVAIPDGSAGLVGATTPNFGFAAMPKDAKMSSGSAAILLAALAFGPCCGSVGKAAGESAPRFPSPAAAADGEEPNEAGGVAAPPPPLAPAGLLGSPRGATGTRGALPTPDGGGRTFPAVRVVTAAFFEARS